MGGIMYRDVEWACVGVTKQLEEGWGIIREHEKDRCEKERDKK